MEYLGLVLLLLGVLVVHPVASWIHMSSLGLQIRDLRRELSDLQEHVKSLRVHLTEPPASVPGSVGRQADVPPLVTPSGEPGAEHSSEDQSTASATGGIPAPTPAPAPDRAPAEELVAAGVRVANPVPPRMEAATLLAADVHPPGLPSPTLTQPPAPFQLEQLLAANWLAGIGIAAIALAMALFLQYAFKAGFIGPTIRVGVGLAVSALMTGSAQFIIRKERYRTYAQVLSSGGIVILFLSIYAAHNLYRLIGSDVAYTVLTTAALAVSALSVRDDSRVVAGLCILGAFATPLLIRSPTDSPLRLYAYLAFLNIWTIGILRYKAWDELIVLAFVVTWGLFLDSQPGDVPSPIAVQFFSTAFFGIGVWGGLRVARSADVEEGALYAGYSIVGLAAIAYGVTSLGVLADTQLLGTPSVLLAAMLVCLSLICIAVLAPESREDIARAHRALLWLAAAALLTLSVTAILSAKPAPQRDALPAFGFLLFSYLVYVGAALRMRTRPGAARIAAALLLVNAVTHAHAAALVLGGIRVHDAPLAGVWLPLAGVLGLAVWWIASRRECEAELTIAFAGSAYLLAGLGMLASSSDHGLSPFTSIVFGAEFVFISVCWLAVRRDFWSAAPQLGLTTVLVNAIAFLPQILRGLEGEAVADVSLGAIAMVLMSLWHASVALTILRRKDGESPGESLARLAHCGAAATGLAIALSVQLHSPGERSSLILAWVCEAGALVWAGLALRDARVRMWGYVLLAVSLMKSLLFDFPRFSPSTGQWPLLNARGMELLGLTLGCWFIGDLLSRRSADLTTEERPVPIALTLIGNGFALLYGSIDLHQWAALHWPQSPLASASQLTLSLYWTAYGLIGAGIGIWRRSRTVRLLSVAILYVTIFKVFIVDLSGLETLYRIASFLALGVVLLIVSLLFTRFDTRLEA